MRLLSNNKDIKQLLAAIDDIMINFKDRAKERKYYQINILKTSRTYHPFESFGELALITNKRRKAKLVVTGDEDAHFALLSKKDYRTAIYKV